MSLESFFVVVTSKNKVRAKKKRKKRVKRREKKRIGNEEVREFEET